MNGALFRSANLDCRTPQGFLDLVYRFRPIALDPCAHPRGLVRAKKYIYPTRRNWRHRADLGGGLTANWKRLAGTGLVYPNPPYGDQIGPWASKIVEESQKGTRILTLVAARTDTKWFQHIMDRGNLPFLCFLRGRLKFVGKKYSAPFPSVAIYFGPEGRRFRDTFADYGFIT